MESQNLIRSPAKAKGAFWAFIADESIFLVLNTIMKENMKNNDKKWEWLEHDRNGHITCTLADRSRLSFDDFLGISRSTTFVNSILA